MIDALIQRVWENPRLLLAINALEKVWLQKALNVEALDEQLIELNDARRYVEAAAILACSDRADQRLASYRLATYAHDLFREQIPGIDASVRSILARLGNFPGIETSKAVCEAFSSTPWVLAEEELVRRAINQVNIGGSLFSLTDFQLVLWKGLSKGSSLAIAAPTSTGKSFILQSYLIKRLSESSSFLSCYIVPTRALISQVQRDLSDSLISIGLDDVEVVTVPIENGEALPPQAIYVMTQERLQLLLANHLAFSPSFLVIDEAHSVEDGDRGIILQSCIDEAVARNPDCQLLFASPAVSNLDVFARMTGRPDVVSERTDQVTVSQNFINVRVVTARTGEVKILAETPAGRHEVGSSVLGETLSSRVDCLVHVSTRFGGGKQSIVFANGQADAEKLAYQIAQVEKSSGQVDISSNERETLADLAKEAVHPKYVLSATVKNGVGFHYGNIPTILRGAIEQAFVEGHLNYLVCTSTLLSGVNLPAKNLFLYAPKRKQGVPLGSVDFWNLAGRAGRLRREFQGNIFLIDYEKWDVQPLSGPKASRITPAIESVLEARLSDLITVIETENPADASEDRGLETVFTRLLSDYKRGRLDETLTRAAMLGGDKRLDLEASLKAADANVTLSAEVISSSPTVSAHRQQDMYNQLLSIVRKSGEAGARSLLMRHPRESSAFESYVSTLSRCHGTLLSRPGSEKQNRFFATMILKWMQGVSLPELIDRRQAYYSSETIDKSIRETLDLVEKELRFSYVRVLGCYAQLLKEALIAGGFPELVRSIPPVALYLEIGASDKTMISLISLGLSRLAAKNLTNICPFKNLDVQGARKWLSDQDLEVLGFSKYIRGEVSLALAGKR